MKYIAKSILTVVVSPVSISFIRLTYTWPGQAEPIVYYY